MDAISIIERVKVYAGDDGADPAWQEDSQWLLALNEGLRWFYDNLPECRLTSAGALNSFTEATYSSTTLFLPDTYRVALENYMLARFFRSDGADARDRNRSREHQAAFDMLVGPPKGGA